MQDVTADLVEWLTSVWDEQAEDAQRAIDLTVDSYPADRFNIWWRWARAYEVRASGAGGFTTASGAPSPTEVLARIAADRKILELHAGEHNCREIVTGHYPADWPEGVSWGKPGTPWRHATNEYYDEGEHCPTARLLAEAHADRPGFRDEWRV